jgi:GNAT superfamily N-acetyltransferase
MMEGLLRIRPGTTEDVEEVSRAYAQAWRETYRGITPEAFLQGMTPGAAAQIFRDSLRTVPPDGGGAGSHSYFFHVAQSPGGRLVGFADGGRERSHPESGMGELYAIYLLKDFQKRGTGRRLFEAAVESLLKSGIHSMVVWVLEPSPYRKFYEALGGKPQPGRKFLDIAGSKLSLVSYGWDDLKSL